MSASLANGVFAGAVARSVVLCGATLAETTYAGGTRIAMHAHDQPLCCVALGGDLIESRSRGSEHVSLGEMLYHPRHEAHRHYFPRATRAFTIQFGGDWLSRLECEGTALSGAPSVMRYGTAPLLAARLQVESRRRDEASALVVEGIMLDLVTELARVNAIAERRPPAWLGRALQALHAASGPGPSLLELGAEAGVHPAHVARTFRRFIGCTPGEYLRRVRLGRARYDLAVGRKPLSIVALEAGFYDQAHFTRVFRRRMGVTPGAYREVMRD